MSSASDLFQTIETPSQGVFKEKGSRFLAFAFPVTCVEEVKQIVQSIQQKYFDARHHCYAYRLGADLSHYRVCDDGEPSNSAGKPILGQIIAFNLTNILVVVVRYFGGILLGVGGLIQAYKTAASEAIKSATIISGMVTNHFHIESDYPTMDHIMKVVKEFHIQAYDQKFHQSCEVSVQIRESLTKEFLDKLQRIESINIRPIQPTSYPTT